MAKTHQIPITMASVSALLVKSNTETGHRGIWFYDPRYNTGIEPGDLIEFVMNGDVVQHARVVKNVEAGDHPKFCSAINSKGFTWEDA